MDALMQSAFSGPLGAALIRLLNMSAAAGALICAVVLLRLALRRAPKWTRCVLWAIVAVQLVCPLTLRSPLSVWSLLPRSDEVKSEQVEVFRAGGGSEKPLLVLDTPQIAGTVPAVKAGTPANAAAAPAQKNPSVYLPAAGMVWLAGLALMLLYALGSYLSLRRRVRFSVPLEGNVFLCDAIATPFILGVLRPRIYLPAGLDAAQKSAVLAHENAHLRRRDHWWKLLGWLLLSIHWFNPLVWLGYVLFCRDVELACDEKVVGALGAAERADYSQTLLDCAAPRAAVRACPLAFGEVGLKERIKAVLNYKKPAFWLVVLAVVVCVVVAVCFLTRPGPIEAPEGRVPVVTPTPRPTAAPEVLPTDWPVYEDIHMESAKVYLLDDAFYPEKEYFHMFTITIDEGSGQFQYYETPISSYIGMGRYELDGDILTIRDFGTGTERVNRFRVEDDGETLVWIGEGSGNFTFIKLIDGASFSLDHTASSAEPPRMTLDDVLALSEKGMELTWEDLLQFESEDIGSGLYIYRFPIDENYCLEVSDGKLTGTPMRALLLPADGSGMFSSASGLGIDIRTEDVTVFLARSRGPYLTVLSGGQSAAAATMMLHERLWSDALGNWIAGDGYPVESLLERPEQIPTLTLADDFALSFGGGAVRKSPLMVYDEQFGRAHDDWYGNTALNWLDPGIYYCGVEVFGPLGRYIEKEDAYEESVWLCVFRLVVPKRGPAPYTPAEARDLTEARLHLNGKTYSVTDPAALSQLESWLSGATVLVGGAGCPFGSVLELTRSDGSVFSLCPAEDSCGTVFAGGTYYRYASDNEAFWALFGVKPFW